MGRGRGRVQYGAQQLLEIGDSLRSRGPPPLDLSTVPLSEDEKAEVRRAPMPAGASAELQCLHTGSQPELLALVVLIDAPLWHQCGAVAV